MATNQFDNIKDIEEALADGTLINSEFPDGIPFECPNCHAAILIKIGTTVCPNCKAAINTST